MDCPNDPTDQKITEAASTCAQDAGFGDYLAHETPGSGAKGGPHGKLVLVAKTTRDEQIGEVRTSDQQQRTIEITPRRGAIYDRNMHPLAMSVPVQSAFAVPSEIGDNA